MGGQVGIADHAKITDGVMVVAKTGIHGHVKEKGIIAGIQQDFMTWKRNQAILKNLDNYLDRIKQPEKKIKEMEEKAK